MLDVVRTLLAEGRAEDVLGVVSSLVNRNTELERRLAQLLTRAHKNEGVSAAQLLLFLNELALGQIPLRGQARSDCSRPDGYGTTQ